MTTPQPIYCEKHKRYTSEIACGLCRTLPPPKDSLKEKETPEGWEERWTAMRSVVVVSGAMEGEKVIDVSAMEKRDINFIQTEIEKAESRGRAEGIREVKEELKPKVETLIKDLIKEFPGSKAELASLLKELDENKTN